MRRLITSHALAGTAVALPWPALLAAVWQTTDDPTLLGLAGFKPGAGNPPKPEACS